MHPPRWAVGDASHQHWVILPDSFDEREQRVICAWCGKPLFPVFTDPRDAGYREDSRKEPQLIPL